ncbi:MAG: LysM peptidoglycan-binding domain-containing protein [Clostridia bacterium]|nr:LysM peptidoglycan-binding domain-containing protein [Clostridia bacterium]
MAKKKADKLPSKDIKTSQNENMGVVDISKEESKDNNFYIPKKYERYFEVAKKFDIKIDKLKRLNPQVADWHKIEGLKLKVK